MKMCARRHAAHPRCGTILTEKVRIMMIGRLNDGSRHYDDQSGDLEEKCKRKTVNYNILILKLNLHSLASRGLRG